MLIAFSVTPLGIGDNVSAPVAAAVKVVRESGLPNQTDAMFTLVEGEWDASSAKNLPIRHSTGTGCTLAVGNIAVTM